MRKPSHLILSLFVTAMLFSGKAHSQLIGDSYSQARQTKTAKFYYVYDEVYGFTSKAESGEMTGILVDMMKAFESYLKDREGITVTSEYIFPEGGDFEIFMKEVREGKGGVFGLSNISINNERKKTFDFSPPYLENVSMLLSNSGVPSLKSMNDISITFSGMTAYTLLNSTYHERLLEIKETWFPEMEIIAENTMGPIMQQMQNNEKAFAILDLNVYLEALQKKWPVKRHPIGDLRGDKFGIIMPKGCDWKSLLDDFMTTFYGSNAYGEIISKNLGGSALKLIRSVSN